MKMCNASCGGSGVPLHFTLAIVDYPKCSGAFAHILSSAMTQSVLCISGVCLWSFSDCFTRPSCIVHYYEVSGIQREEHARTEVGASRL